MSWSLTRHLACSLTRSVQSSRSILPVTPLPIMRNNNQLIRLFSSRERDSLLPISNCFQSIIQKRYRYVKKKETGLNKNHKLVLAGALVGCVGGLVYYIGDPDPNKPDLYKDENFLVARLYRFRDSIHDTIESFEEPAREVLLPDPVQYPYYQPPYTLVIETNNVLIKSEYSANSGWRYKKRAGVEQFLRALGSSGMFEIVFFTMKDGGTIQPTLEALDKEHDKVAYKLYRDSTHYIQGTHVKDLSKLNRDLTKVILIDTDEKAAQLQPRNSLILPPWDGNPKDIQLLELITFFQSIYTYKVDDTRTILDTYRGDKDPIGTLRRNQENIRRQQEELNSKMMKQQEQRSRFGAFGNAFRR